jgi:hypothetical protein
MKTASFTFFGFFYLVLFLSGCQTAPKVETNSANTIVVSASPTPKTETLETFPIVDVPKLANKSIAEIEGILGKPIEAKPIKDPNPGEYRVYKIANHEKGLAVRFYRGQAKNFNLILSKPFSTSKEALLKGFGIEVGNPLPKIDPNEPLSEKWFGTFNGVKFAVVYAKKQRPETNEFIFVLAEVE